MVHTLDPRRQEVLAIIADSAGMPAAENATLDDLKMDSLDIVELTFVIEDRYGNAFQIDDDHWEGPTTVREVIDDVLALLDA